MGEWGAPTAIPSLAVGVPGKGWEPGALIPALILAHPRASLGAAGDGWMGVWISCVCGCARMTVSVCQGTCADMGWALQVCTWDLDVLTPYSWQGWGWEVWGFCFSREMLRPRTLHVPHPLSPQQPCLASSCPLCIVRGKDIGALETHKPTSIPQTEVAQEALLTGLESGSQD
jgi:hypothetical protein